MSTINRLSSVDALQPGDLIPVWDGSNGDTRKASLTTLLAFIESNFADPDYSTRIVAPNVDGFNVDIGNTGDSSWLIVNPTLNYTTGSITLPSTVYAVNDQEITVVFTAQVASFSITGAGATVLGAPTQIGTYDSFRVRYNAAQLTWYTLDTTGDGSGSGTSSIVRQDFTGDGVVTTFALANAPAALGNELQVFIDGVYQERAGYSVSGNDLVFSEAPPVLSTIEVLAWGVNDIGATTANLVTYTPAGTGAVAATVQDKLRESVSVKDFGAVGDGVADDTAAIQAAFAASLIVYFPVGTYLTSSAIKLGDGNARRVYGSGRGSSTIINRTSDVFKIESNDAGYLHMSDLAITSDTGGGHCFIVTTNSSMMSFDNLLVDQKNAAKSIWQQLGGFCGLVTWDQCRFYASTSTLTAHPFNIQSTEIVNGWSFKNIRCEKTLGTLQFFNLNSSNSSSFITNCSFENITFQEPYGGWIKLGGCRGVEIRNCASYDMSSAQTGHGILITESAGGKSSSRCKISHCGRYPSVGGTLAAGIQDIKLDSGAGFFAQSCIIEACFNSSAGATFTVDYGNNAVLHIDRPGPTESAYTNDSNVQFIDFGGGNQGSGMAAFRTIPTNSNRELTIAAGSITPTLLYQIVDTEGGAASDDLDTIVGTNMLAGDILTLRNVTSSRAVTVKDGTGNLALEGDFVLNNDKDTIQLLWNGSSFQETSRSNNS